MQIPDTLWSDMPLSGTMQTHKGDSSASVVLVAGDQQSNETVVNKYLCH